MKPGWKSSEFWMRFAAMAISAALASGAVPSEGPWLQLLGGAGTLLSMFGYSAERAELKLKAMSLNSMAALDAANAARDLGLKPPPVSPASGLKTF